MIIEIINIIIKHLMKMKGFNKAIFPPITDYWRKIKFKTKILQILNKKKKLNQNL